jgi:hypothetical protein
LLTKNKVLVLLDTANAPLQLAAGDFEQIKVKASSIAALDSNGDGKDELALVVGKSIEVWEWDAGGSKFERTKQISLGAHAVADADSAAEAKKAKTVASVMDGAKRNGDKFEDLVVGLPEAKVGKVAKAGVVLEFLGSKNGLAGKPSKVHTRATTQKEAGMEAVQPTANDRFGAQLHTVDFDDVGGENLLIGCPFCFNGTGGFWVERNDKTFLGQFLSVPGSFFGWAFSEADLNGDAVPDFVVGAPGVDQGAVKNAGAVYGYLGAAEAAPTFQSSFPAPLGNLGQNTPLGFGASLDADRFFSPGSFDVVMVGAPCLNVLGKDDAGGIVPIVLQNAQFPNGGVSPPLHFDGTIPGTGSPKAYVHGPNESSLLTARKMVAGLCAPDS